MGAIHAAILSAIDAPRAQEDWAAQRPYFFAVRRGQTHPMQTFSMAAYALDFSGGETAMADFDASWALFCIKSCEPLRLIPLAPLQAFIEQGITALMLRQMWDDAADSDEDNLWEHAGRATMAALFIHGAGLVEPDAFYGHHLLATTPNGLQASALEGALYQAIVHRAPVALVTMLLRTGANPNCDLGMYDWRSALAVAVQHGAHDVVRAMLDYGADPHWQGMEEAQTGHDAARTANDLVALELFAQAERPHRFSGAAPST